MNLFKKLYCRLFQLAFRIAMPILPYREPIIVSDPCALANILSEKKASAALIVTGPRLYSMGATRELEAALSGAGIDAFIYSDTCADPDFEAIEQARQIYVENNCDCIIALGGGSPIDCAKAVGARIAYPEKQLRSLVGVLKVRRRIPLLIAIPTTAGTGSEVTLSAVVSERVGERKIKYTMNSFSLIPSYALLEPRLTVSMPPKVTATTGMDALTHAVEAYIGRATTKKTRKAAEEAVTLIFKHIERAYSDGNDLEARSEMLRASYLAGIAFSRSYVGYVHAVAHTLGGTYGISHGLANAVLLPEVLKIYGTSVYKSLHRLAVLVGLASESDSYKHGAERFIGAIRELNAKMNIPDSFSEISEGDVSKMAKRADREANPLYPVPKLMSARELETIYRVVAR